MRTRFLSHTEVERLRQAMRPQEWALCWLMSETGLRISDALELKWEDYDDESQSFTFTAKKTGKSGVACVTVELLRELRKLGGQGYVFKSPRRVGKPITRQAAWKRIKRACGDCGLPPRGIANHSFRKVFAVDTFRRGGLAAAKAALQHESAEVTEVYVLSDFMSERNENIPLFRKDVPVLLHLLRDLLER